MSHKMLRLIGIIGIVFLGIIYISPYYTTWCIQMAVINNDNEELNRHLNYDKIRDNLKNQVKEQINKINIENVELSNIIKGFSNKVSNIIIDNSLSKENINQLLKNKQTIHEEVKINNTETNLKENPTVELGYKDINEFSIRYYKRETKYFEIILERKNLFTWEATAFKLD